MGYTIQVLRQLYVDFPSSDPTVRVVILLAVLLSDNYTHTTYVTLKPKFEQLGLLPLTRKDIYNIMTNPFVERYAPVSEFAVREMGFDDKEMKELIEEVAIRCLEVGCKVSLMVLVFSDSLTLDKQGKMLRRLLIDFPFLHDTIATVIMQRYQISQDDLPLPEDEKSCVAYEARLCRDFIMLRFSDIQDVPVGSEAEGVEGAEEHAGEDNGDEGNEETEGYVVGGGDDDVDEDIEETDTPELVRAFSW
jgi:hypothetical protein